MRHGIPAPADAPPDLETILIARPHRDARGEIVDGIIEFANDAWRRLFGDLTDDPVGRRVSEFALGGMDDPRLRALRDVAEHGTALRFVLPHPRLPELTGDLRVAPIHDGRILFTSRESGGAWATRAELDDSERRYRELAEQVFDGVLVLDRDGRVAWANRRATELLGVAAGDFEGLAYLQRTATVHATEAERVAARHRLDAGEVVTGDAAVTRFDGVRLVLEQRARRDPDGSTVVMIRDVTAIRAADDERHDRLVADARTEALGRLAGGIAHDLNNHLTSLLGYADLAQADAGSPEQLANDLRQIVAASERAQEVTRRFLAFGRRSLLRPRPLDLADALAEIEPALRHVAGNRLALIVGPAPDLPPVMVDPAMLQRALVALVENARDAMRGRGVLGVTTAASTDEDGVEGGPWARLRIEDTGIGMAPHELARAFEPFSDGPGGGLGLPMVQGFVDQSGGHLRIASTPGEGTTVSLYLPFATADAARDRPASGPADGGPSHARDRERPATILVVDDEPLIREVAERVLAREGYTIVRAASGEEALAVAADLTRDIDLLFTDVVMPGMHGVALANVLRRQRPGIRVLVTSGYSQTEIDRQGISGESAYLPKPYTPQDLVGAVRSALVADAAG